jgi:hypothetical protein
MAVIGSDGLGLRIGDGAPSEVFYTLKGAVITRLDIGQRGHVASSISADGWQTQIGTSGRQVVIECEAYANDEPAAVRLRSAALTGTRVNMELETHSNEHLAMQVYVVRYQENAVPGDIKKIICRLESSGAASLV